MTNKQRYEQFCNEHPEIPLFMQVWWLNSVCVDKTWDVLLCEENNKIIGAMPYHLLKKWGFTIIIQPQKTQYTGIWIDYPSDMKLHKRYSFEKRVMNNLIDQLEALKISFYSQNFHHSFTNWQPFYWRGFEQNTRYTYVLENIANTDTIFKNIQARCQEKIRKCEREMTLDFNLSPKEFYQFHKKTLKEKHEEILYSEYLLLSIFQTVHERKQGKIIAVRNKNNELISAIFLVWDTHCAYNLNTARKTIDGSNDATAFLFFEAIKYASSKTKNFDFEGSMIEGVATVNQQFGAKQVPYFNMSKSSSTLFSIAMVVKNIFFR